MLNEDEKIITLSKEKSKLTEKETKLIKMLRGIRYGELRIIVQNQQPVRVEEIRRSIDF